MAVVGVTVGAPYAARDDALPDVCVIVTILRRERAWRRHVLYRVSFIIIKSLVAVW